MAAGEPNPLRSRDPVRIQRRRTKGWRMPEGAVYVGRPTSWGNPFNDLPVFVGIPRAGIVKVGGRDLFAADAFRLWLDGKLSFPPSKLAEELYRRRQAVLGRVHELRGRDLACWCGESMPCHADVLLELANGSRASVRDGDG